MSDAVLVTDGEQRPALAVARSLGRAGYRVYVTSESGRSLAGASRWTTAERRVSSARGSVDAFVSDIERTACELGVSWILPITDHSLQALLPVRGRFIPARIPFAEADAYGRISDKSELLALARQEGIAVPDQIVLRDPHQDSELLRHPPPFPFVLKPWRSVVRHNGTLTTQRVVHVANADRLRTALTGLPPSAYPVLVQRRIEGPGIGVFLLVWDGRVRAVFSHRRLREKPPSGGVSVYAESIDADDALVTRAARLLERFAWDGVAMVEFKVDRSTSTPYLMEVNGRFWGSLQLAIDSGVNFPLLLLGAASGAPPQAPPLYRVGVRSRWWWGDVDHLVLRLRRTKEQLALSSGAPSRLRAVADFLVWRGSDRNEVLQLRDPLPFVHETWQWMHGR